MSDEPSAPTILEELVHRAEAAGASDIHLQMDDQAAQVLFRLDGVMTSVTSLAPDVAERVFGRIKFLARMKTYQDSLPQDGRIDKADIHARHDIRVATYPTVTGEKVVMRLFNEAAAKSLREMEFPPEACRGVLERLMVMCPDHHAVSSVLALVLNERLLRRVCVACKGSGCEACTRTGYRGRVPVVEWICVNDALRERVRAGGPGVFQPSDSITQNARRWVETGVTTAAEVDRVLGTSLNPDEAQNGP